MIGFPSPLKKMGRRGRDRMVVGLYLQLPLQSVPITTNVVSSNPAHDEADSIQHHG